LKDPYVYPGTTVLKNNLNIRDQRSLDKAEADIVGARFLEAISNGMPGAFSPKWHKAIHKQLFNDVYPFAGVYRTMDIAKAGEAPYAKTPYLAENAETIFGKLATRTDLAGLNAAAFRRELATIMGDIHVLHPFREGNTRTLQVATFEIAARAGHFLDWRRADPKLIRAAGTAAAYGITQPYEKILEEIDAPRSDRRIDFTNQVRTMMLKTSIPESMVRQITPAVGTSVEGRILAVDDGYVAVKMSLREFMILEAAQFAKPVRAGEQLTLRIGEQNIAIESRDIDISSRKR
jgi:cell filamentation protein